jgi:lysophospholipase L1-like esterase
MTTSLGTGRRPAAHRGRWISLVLAVLLVGSTVANVYLVRYALDSFKTSNAIRLDPIGLKVYANDRAHPPGPHPLLVFFGDSRALMWGHPVVPGYTVANRGIGWQTTAQILARVENDVIAMHPDVVVLEAGVNDLKVIAEAPERRAEIVAECEGNLARIVDACRASGATVVIASVFEIGDLSVWKRPFWSDDVGVAVREVNEFLATLARDGVIVFDANGPLDDGHGTIRRPYQADYLHLDGEGYAALNQKLLPLVSGAPR